MLRRTPLRRRRWMRKRLPKRLERRAADRPYLNAVRAMDCLSCGRHGPSEAAHMPIGPRGVGLKSPDRNTVPLYRGCHRWFDGHTSSVLPREERRALAVKWLADVELATTPGPDASRDDALVLEAAGLGHVEMHPDGSWSWRAA